MRESHGIPPQWQRWHAGQIYRYANSVSGEHPLIPSDGVDRLLGDWENCIAAQAHTWEYHTPKKIAPRQFDPQKLDTLVLSKKLLSLVEDQDRCPLPY